MQLHSMLLSSRTIYQRRDKTLISKDQLLHQSERNATHNTIYISKQTFEPRSSRFLTST